jgi:hypothetical protein
MILVLVAAFVTVSPHSFDLQFLKNVKHVTFFLQMYIAMDFDDVKNNCSCNNSIDIHNNL